MCAQELAGHPAGRDHLILALLPIHQVDQPAIRVQERGSLRHDELEQRITFQCAGDCAAGLLQRGELRDLAVGILVQPGILDGNGGLVGERL